MRTLIAKMSLQGGRLLGHELATLRFFAFLFFALWVFSKSTIAQTSIDNLVLTPEVYRMYVACLGRSDARLSSCFSRCRSASCDKSCENNWQSYRRECDARAVEANSSSSTGSTTLPCNQSASCEARCYSDAKLEEEGCRAMGGRPGTDCMIATTRKYRACGNQCSQRYCK